MKRSSVNRCRPQRCRTCGPNYRTAGRPIRVPYPAIGVGSVRREPFVLNHSFVPDTTRVPVGTRVTWTNDDQVKHTVMATDGTFSGDEGDRGGPVEAAPNTQVSTSTWSVVTRGSPRPSSSGVRTLLASPASAAAYQSRCLRTGSGPGPCRASTGVHRFRDHGVLVSGDVRPSGGREVEDNRGIDRRS